MAADGSTDKVKADKERAVRALAMYKEGYES